MTRLERAERKRARRAWKRLGPAAIPRMLGLPYVPPEQLQPLDMSTVPPAFRSLAKPAWTGVTGDTEWRVERTSSCEVLRGWRESPKKKPRRERRLNRRAKQRMVRLAKRGEGGYFLLTPAEKYGRVRLGGR